MTRALTSALAIAVLGCLPDITLSPCTSNQDCIASNDGLCRCLNGYCFRGGCPPPPIGVPSGDVPGDAPTDAAPALPGTCTDDLENHALEPSCVLESGALGVATAVLPPAVADDGRLLVVATSGGKVRLLVYMPDLTPAWTGDIEATGATVAQAPVVLADGATAAVAQSGDVALFDAGGKKSTLATGAPASAVCELPTGDLVIVLATGHVARITRAGELTTSDAALVAAGAVAHVALAGDRLYVTDTAGAAVVVKLGQITDAKALWTMTEGQAATAPAVGATGAMYVGTSAGRVAGGTPGVPDWLAVQSEDVGLTPLGPIVIAGETVVIASGGAKRVTAVQYSGSAATVVWTAEGLADVPSTPPLAYGPSAVLVGLNNGWLVSLEPDGPKASLGWYYVSGQSPAAGAPVQTGDGAVLYLTREGTLRWLVAAPTTTPHPWPRLRYDRRSSGVGQ